MGARALLFLRRFRVFGGSPFARPSVDNGPQPLETEDDRPLMTEGGAELEVEA